MKKVIIAHVSLHSFTTTQENIKTTDEKEHHPYKYIHLHQPQGCVGFSSWPSPTEAVGYGSLGARPPHCPLQIKPRPFLVLFFKAGLLTLVLQLHSCYVTHNNNPKSFCNQKRKSLQSPISFFFCESKTHSTGTTAFPYSYSAATSPNPPMGKRSRGIQELWVKFRHSLAAGTVLTLTRSWVTQC